MIILTEKQFESAQAKYSGYCKCCAAKQSKGVEGDAEDYPCKKCGKLGLCGMDTLLIMGLIALK